MTLWPWVYIRVLVCMLGGQVVLKVKMSVLTAGNWFRKSYLQPRNLYFFKTPKQFQWSLKLREPLSSSANCHAENWVSRRPRSSVEDDWVEQQPDCRVLSWWPCKSKWNVRKVTRRACGMLCQDECVMVSKSAGCALTRWEERIKWLILFFFSFLRVLS
jgi:hypothetical protein